jgi:hydroxyacylglutathione hydrolase
MLEIVTVPVLADNYIYLLHDDVAQETAVVDPALAQPVLDALSAKNWQLNYIFNTHHHSDHVGGNLELKTETGCQVIGAQADAHRIPGLDRSVLEGDSISLGAHKAYILDTPGHTLGHIVYYFVDDALLFCGDTLFVMGCGRLFEGSAAQMWHSLQKLKSLPLDTKVYCAHEYTLANGKFALTMESNNPTLQKRMIEVQHCRNQNRPTVPTTIAEELATNPFFREDSLELQQTIGLVNDNPVAVFTEVRRLKNNT